MVALLEFLQGGLARGTPSGAQGSFSPRIPMMFTSTLRQRTAGNFGREEGNDELGDFLARAGSQLMPTIAMLVNPDSVKFVQRKRITKRDTREGSVYFHFTNSRGQNNDILEIQFSGNTGNIDLRGSLGDPNQPDATGGMDTGALQKLLVWHNLYLLTREPKLLADGTDNVCSIIYSSPLYPIEIRFDGHFDAVLEYEENADKPNTRNYHFTFVAEDSDPPLDEYLGMLSEVLSTPKTTVSLPTLGGATSGARFIQRGANDPGSPDPLAPSGELPTT